MHPLLLNAWLSFSECNIKAECLFPKYSLFDKRIGQASPSIFNLAPLNLSLY